MTTRYALNLLVAIAMCFLSGGVAWAQAADAKQISDEDLSLIDENVANMSEKQMVDRATGKIGKMRKTLTSVTELLSTVRENERDILKVNCINEKHAAIKGFVKVSEQSYIGLENAVKAGDREESEHNYKLVSLAHQRVQSLAEEARLCTGEERRFAGKGDLQVVQPNNGKEEVDGADEGDILTEDLPELTPYQ